MSEVRKMLGPGAIADSVGWSNRDGCFVAKRVYFYRNGMTAEKFADALRLACDPWEMRLKSVSDVWKAWPAESYFECRFDFVPERAVVQF